MSDNQKAGKAKRGYRIDGGKALCCDLRVRLDAETAKKLAEAAERKKTTRAAIAREILKNALTAEK